MVALTTIRLPNIEGRGATMPHIRFLLLALLIYSIWIMDEIYGFFSRIEAATLRVGGHGLNK
jgi:hypothetical protein